jgi:hypothetical protein
MHAPQPTPQAAAAPAEHSLLDQLLPETVAAPAARPTPEALVGECLDNHHPTLTGRALVRYAGADGQTVERWLPTLYGITVRAADRVLLQQPANWPEPLIVGVVDGFALRPERPYLPGPSVVLQKDETLRVTAPDGTPLVEIRQDEKGPVVRLLAEQTNLDLPGSLRIAAESIELDAKQGGMTLKAADDVTVQGEMIQLN